VCGLRVKDYEAGKGVSIDWEHLGQISHKNATRSVIAKLILSATLFHFAVVTRQGWGAQSRVFTEEPLQYGQPH